LDRAKLVPEGNACHHPGVSVSFLVIVLFWVTTVALWVWALVDAIQVPDDRFYRAGTKLVWVLVIVLTGALGAIVYFAAGRPDPATRATMRSSGPPGAVPPQPPGMLPPPPDV
jgi:hypothetical protein